MLTMKLGPSSITDNKLRWERYDIEDDTYFELYIPQWRVPEPWPAYIYVTIHEWAELELPRLIPASANNLLVRLPILTGLTRVEEHTRTAKFTPGGEVNEREIGDPYIPFSCLPSKDVERVIIEVVWDMASRREFNNLLPHQKDNPPENG